MAQNGDEAVCGGAGKNSYVKFGFFYMKPRGGK